MVITHEERSKIPRFHGIAAVSPLLTDCDERLIRIDSSGTPRCCLRSSEPANGVLWHPAFFTWFCPEYYWPGGVEFKTTGIRNFHLAQRSELSMSSVMKWATFDRVVGLLEKALAMGDLWMSYGETSAPNSEPGRTLHHST